MKYFTIKEIIKSSTAEKLKIDNTPNGEVINNLTELINEILDPLREYMGKPLIINSGYRSEALNKAVGGAVNSRHMKGTCADITLGSISKNKEAFEWIKKNCEFRQLIWEKGGQWIHVEYCQNDNKKQILNIK